MALSLLVPVIRNTYTKSVMCRHFSLALLNIHGCACVGCLDPYKPAGVRCWHFRNVFLNQGTFCKLKVLKQQLREAGYIQGTFKNK